MTNIVCLHLHKYTFTQVNLDLILDHVELLSSNRCYFRYHHFYSVKMKIALKKTIEAHGTRYIMAKIL